MATCEFSLALHQMMGETDRSHTKDIKFEDWYPQGCEVANRKYATDRSLKSSKAQKGQGRSGAAIVSLACAARSEMQSGDQGCEDFNERSTQFLVSRFLLPEPGCGAHAKH